MRMIACKSSVMTAKFTLTNLLVLVVLSFPFWRCCSEASLARLLWVLRERVPRLSNSIVDLQISIFWLGNVGGNHSFRIPTPMILETLAQRHTLFKKGLLIFVNLTIMFF